MKAVIQRVKSAEVRVDGEVTGACGRGLCILLGVADGDDRVDAELLAAKIAKLRIFSDENGKMNLSVKDIGGGALIVSNFTLYADYRHGNRPEYFGAAAPDKANELYLYFTELMRREINEVGCGVFGAHMEVSIAGDGPVTIVMESDILKNRNKG